MGRGVRAARTLAMLRAERIERIGHWPRELARGTVTLAYDDRHRRRLRLMSDAGEPFLLDLSRTAILEEGDGLALSDGTPRRHRHCSRASLGISATGISRRRSKRSASSSATITSSPT